MLSDEIRILWIEDDYRLLLPLIEPMRKNGYIFDFAVNETEAYSFLNQKIYNLIILDIILPSGVYSAMTEPEPFIGLRIAERILVDMKIETPIIVISVVNDENVKRQLRLLGIQEIMNKGRILPSELKIRVDRIIKKYNEIVY